MVITPELIKEWKAERRKNIAAKKAADMARMKELMATTRNWLRAESQGAMDRALEVLDAGSFGEEVKDTVLRGGKSYRVLNVSQVFSGLSNSNSVWRCQHQPGGEIHDFGSRGCEWCASLLERELRSVLAEVSKARGLKFRLPKNSQYVILSL